MRCSSGCVDPARPPFQCRKGGLPPWFGRDADVPGGVPGPASPALPTRVPRLRSPLMTTVTLDALDLAALLCSRVCHDVISPVGAIVNGLEVMEDDSDASMRDFALDLIQKSAKQASARLQFARLAFGAAGSAGASIDLGDAEQVARGLFLDDKIAFSWSSPPPLFPQHPAKLLLHLIITATPALPRGGPLAATVEGDAAGCALPIVS